MYLLKSCVTVVEEVLCSPSSAMVDWKLFQWTTLVVHSQCPIEEMVKLSRQCYHVAPDLRGSILRSDCFEHTCSPINDNSTSAPQSEHLIDGKMLAIA